MTPRAEHCNDSTPVRVRRERVEGTIVEWSHTAGGHTRARVKTYTEDGLPRLTWYHAHELELVDPAGARSEVAPHD